MCNSVSFGIGIDFGIIWHTGLPLPQVHRFPSRKRRSFLARKKRGKSNNKRHNLENEKSRVNLSSIISIDCKVIKRAATVPLPSCVREPPPKKKKKY
jgi:hypothetical protein